MERRSKELTDEEVIELWEENIQQILKTGNVYQGNRGLPRYTGSKTDMIIDCLIRVVSVQEGVHYIRRHPDPNRWSKEDLEKYPKGMIVADRGCDGVKLKQQEVKDIVGLIEEAEQIIYQYEKQQEDKDEE